MLETLRWYGKPIVAIFKKQIFQFKESILVQFNAWILVQYGIFWFNFRFCIQHFLHSIHIGILQCDSFGSTFFFSIQWHILRSTLFFSFNAIYFRSKTYCTAVDRNKFVPSLHRILTGLYSPPKQNTQTTSSCDSTNSANRSLISYEVLVSSRRSFRACEKDLRRRDC